MSHFSFIGWFTATRARSGEVADSRTHRIFCCRREVAMTRFQQKCQAWWRTWKGFRVALLRALSVWVV
jgi:hypothetical protein